MRKLRRRHNRWVGNFYAVVQLIFLLQAAQNGNRRFYTWLVN